MELDIFGRLHSQDSVPFRGGRHFVELGYVVVFHRPKDTGNILTTNCQQEESTLLLCNV